MSCQGMGSGQVGFINVPKPRSRRRQRSNPKQLRQTNLTSAHTRLIVHKYSRTRYLAHLEKRQVHVSVGTYNVWMMPRKVSAFTSCSPKKNTRARLIGDLLPPCDIWVLTECFDYRARDILLDKMTEAGYFFFSPTVGHKRINKSNMRKLLNGGVLLASKYPILSVRVKLFEGACAGADKLADKGVLYCKILKDGLLVHVFSTHLQAWNDPLSRTMRKLQMDMIANFMRAMDIDEVNDVVLFVGDLNVDYHLNKTNQEYDEMLNIFEAKDPSAVHPRKLGNASDSDKKESAAEFKHLRKYSFDPRVNALAADGLSTDGSLELLDYILYSRTHRQPTTASSWVQPLTTSQPWMWRNQPQYNLSDHFPVVSEFTFDISESGPHAKAAQATKEGARGQGRACGELEAAQAGEGVGSGAGRVCDKQEAVRAVEGRACGESEACRVQKEICGKAALVATELPKEVGADMTTPEMNKERLNVQQIIGDCVKSRASGQGAAEAPERGAVVMATQVAKEVQKKVDDGPAALRKIIEKKLEEMVPGQWQPGFAVFLKPSNHAKQKDYVPLVESSAFKAQLEDHMEPNEMERSH
ncbi:uncharacterized protein PITG_14450 [Phytophthora infestans T30-4]|uniref:sphingomyelin phosphodiesterase n=1 Tax=Phytophthora infestans (strain T30-4) TaxID=403677 RepID=D0NPV8_PHYIT|nr:uncharacterized protein PITG_14450 [Phytophthora infestans T30-4]EEY62670.1 conserved hypothetical protein [Phytophthora infestans T30-4]|eukprot:XP_002898912.1 conserved hypothetical protein [Phytophthora infestans T30-4]